MPESVESNGHDAASIDLVGQFFIVPHPEESMLIRVAHIVMPGDAVQPMKLLGEDQFITQNVLSSMPDVLSAVRLVQCVENSTIHSQPGCALSLVAFQVINEGSFGYGWRLGDLDMFNGEHPLVVPLERYIKETEPEFCLISVVYSQLVTRAWSVGYKLACWPPPDGCLELYAIPMYEGHNASQMVLSLLVEFLGCQVKKPEEGEAAVRLIKDGRLIAELTFVESF